MMKVNRVYLKYDSDIASYQKGVGTDNFTASIKVRNAQKNQGDP